MRAFTLPTRALSPCARSTIMASIAKYHVLYGALFGTSCTTSAHTDRANARSACSEFARALMRPMSPSRLRQPASIVACMWHLRDKGKYTRHTPLVRMSCGDHALSCHSRIRTHILEESCACPSLPAAKCCSIVVCMGRDGHGCDGTSKSPR